MQRSKPKFPGLVVFGRPHERPPLALADLEREWEFVPPLHNEELLGWLLELQLWESSELLRDDLKGPTRHHQRVLATKDLA